MAAIISYTDAVQSLKSWIEALQATASGQSYSIGGRTLTRQDNETIRAEIQRWHNTVTSLEAARRGKVRALGSTAAFPRPGAGSPAHGVLYPGELWRSY